MQNPGHPPSAVEPAPRTDRLVDIPASAPIPMEERSLLIVPPVSPAAPRAAHEDQARCRTIRGIRADGLRIAASP